MQNIEEQIEQLVAKEFERSQAEYAEAHRPRTPSPEEEIQARLAKARFQERVADYAIAAGVRPASVRFVVRDAADVFELRDNALVPRGGATDPDDPLEPLTPLRWLKGLRTTDEYLFADGGSR